MEPNRDKETWEIKHHMEQSTCNQQGEKKHEWCRAAKSRYVEKESVRSFG